MRTDRTLHPPRVQVQVVTYDSADSIILCLKSVLSQTIPIHRIVVIDNASRDNTVDIVKRTFPAIYLICNLENRGYAGGHNVGFAAAQSDGLDYVVTINPDVILETDYIKQLVESMATDATLGGVTGKLLRLDNHKPACRLLDSTGLYVDYFYHAHDRGSGKVDSGQYDDPGYVWGICGAAALYRVQMLADLSSDAQAFDETFFLYKEDVDLCWQARRRGWFFWYTPVAQCHHHRGWKSGSKMPDLATAYSYCNQVAILIRHASGPPPRLVLTLCVEMIRLVLLSLERPTVAVRGLVLLRKSWRNHWRCRSEFKARELSRECSGYGIRYSRHL